MWPLTDSLWIRLIPSSSATEFENDRSTHSLDTESDKLLVFQRIRDLFSKLSFPSAMSYMEISGWLAERPLFITFDAENARLCEIWAGKVSMSILYDPFSSNLLSNLSLSSHFCMDLHFPEQVRRVIAALKIRIWIFKNVDEAEEANERTKRG